jgi:hypothetical protein
MEREFGFSGVLLWKVRCSRVNRGFFVGKILATGSEYVRRAADARRKCGGNGGRVWERGARTNRNPTHDDEAVMDGALGKSQIPAA